MITIASSENSERQHYDRLYLLTFMLSFKAKKAVCMGSIQPPFNDLERRPAVWLYSKHRNILSATLREVIVPYAREPLNSISFSIRDLASIYIEKQLEYAVQGSSSLKGPRRFAS